MRERACCEERQLLTIFHDLSQLVVDRKGDRTVNDESVGNTAEPRSAIEKSAGAKTFRQCKFLLNKHVAICVFHTISNTLKLSHTRW